LADALGIDEGVVMRAAPQLPSLMLLSPVALVQKVATLSAGAWLATCERPGRAISCPCRLSPAARWHVHLAGGGKLILCTGIYTADS
jgi:hypothetical protein